MAQQCYVRLEPAVDARVRALAAERAISVAAVIRELVQAGLAVQQPQEPLPCPATDPIPLKTYQALLETVLLCRHVIAWSAPDPAVAQRVLKDAQSTARSHAHAVSVSTAQSPAAPPTR